MTTLAKELAERDENIDTESRQVDYSIEKSYEWSQYGKKKSQREILSQRISNKILESLKNDDGI